jgi:hypothetical protein
MKKNYFLALILVPLGFLSCKKSSSDSTPDQFMSFTAGSSWNYQQTTNPSSATPTNSNYTLTCSSNDTLINTKTYKKFTSTNGQTEYYNLTGNDYYTFYQLPAFLGGSRVENIYLKSNAPVGNTWTQNYPVTVSGFNLTLNLTNKIDSLGINRTVNGVTYTNVTLVKTDFTISGIPSFISYTLNTDIYYYYAPKVGQIENSQKITFTTTAPGVAPVNFDQKLKLLTSTIL